METLTLKPNKQTSPHTLTTARFVGGMAVRAFDPEQYAHRIPLTWEDQPEVVAASRYAAISLVHPSLSTAYRHHLEKGIAERTQAVASFIGTLLQHSDFHDDVVVTLVRSKSLESIAAKTQRKPDPMYDLHAMQLVTRAEDPKRAGDVLEYLRETTGTPYYGPDGKPIVAKLGNRHSSDGFSGQQAKLLALVDDQIVPAEVQAYTPGEYAKYWETRPIFENNRGYGNCLSSTEVSLHEGYMIAAYAQLLSAGIVSVPQYATVTV